MEAGRQGRNGLASPPHLTVQRESAWDIPGPHQSGGTQQPPKLPDSMAGSTPKTSCSSPVGNRQLGKAPGKGQAAWDGAVGRAAGLHPLRRGHTREGSTREPKGQGSAS